jgi:hypothetical protein
LLLASSPIGNNQAYFTNFHTLIYSFLLQLNEYYHPFGITVQLQFRASQILSTMSSIILEHSGS